MFKKSTQQEPTETIQQKETEQQKKPALKQKVPYYEIWSDIIQTARFWRLISFLSMTGFFIMVFMSIKIMNKPPVVIRIDAQGNPSVAELKSMQNISEQEVHNFVAYFITYWREWDFYAYDSNFSRVFSNMMTSDMVSRSNNFLTTTKIIEQIKSQELKFKISLSEIIVKSQDKNFLTIEVFGTRTEGSYKNNDKKNIRFMAKLVLQIVPRTTSPWGLLCNSYEEQNFDK